MATACDICGKLYNREDHIIRGRRISSYTNALLFIRRDGAGRPYLDDIQCCPDCANKVLGFIRTIATSEDKPEFLYSPSEHAS